jgi:hypothetical protein
MKSNKPLKLPDYIKSEKASSKPDWMMTDTATQSEALEAQKMLSGMERPPEIWFTEGEDKMLRFRDPGPVALLWRYSVMIGDRWRQFTSPEKGETDLFRDQLQLRPSLRAVYEVIDINGYEDQKTGKKMRHIPRFLVANTRLFEQLEMIRKKRGGLNGFNIEISRKGTGTQTTYGALPESPSPMRPEWKSAKRLRDDFEKYYAPPSEAEQEMLVTRTSRSDE